jgi:hypothetical protein
MSLPPLSFLMPLSWQVVDLGRQDPLFTHSWIKFPCVNVQSNVWCYCFEEGLMDWIFHLHSFVKIMVFEVQQTFLLRGCSRSNLIDPCSTCFILFILNNQFLGSLSAARFYCMSIYALLILNKRFMGAPCVFSLPLM